jgi:hypothetical protein
MLNTRSASTGRQGELQLKPVHLAVKTYLETAVQEWKALALVVSPYIPVALAFVGFVIWNGGIVLGHQEMHAASHHYAQVPYFLAFSTLVGWPVLFNEGIWRASDRAIRLGTGTPV